MLRHYGADVEAEALLLKLIDAVEQEADSKAWGVAPWYYKQLAVLYRKRGDLDAEVAVLERFASAPHATGEETPKLLGRLEKARPLRDRRAAKNH